MAKKQHYIKLDYKHGVIDVKKIDPSPFQVRKYFDEDKLEVLATSIQREGLIEPIVVRRKKDHYELIAGERRFRAVRDYATLKAIPAQIVMEEEPGQSIRIDDYIDLLKRTGWEITHIIDCPLSTQRFQANMVRRMQKNRTLGVVRRSLIMGRKR